MHSKTINPGKPGGLRALEDDSGIVKIDSETQDPEFGILNLRSSQMAVASLSGFRDNHISHGSCDVAGLTPCIWFLMTLSKDP